MIACVTHAVFVNDVVIPSFPRGSSPPLSMSRNAWHSLNYQTNGSEKRYKEQRTKKASQKIASNIKRKAPTKPNQWSFLGPPLVIWALRVSGSALALSAYRPWALSLSGSTLSPLCALRLWIRPWSLWRPLSLALLTYFLNFPRHHLENICFVPNKVPQAIRLVLLS